MDKSMGMHTDSFAAGTTGAAGDLGVTGGASNVSRFRDGSGGETGSLTYLAGEGAARNFYGPQSGDQGARGESSPVVKNTLLVGQGDVGLNTSHPASSHSVPTNSDEGGKTENAGEVAEHLEAQTAIPSSPEGYVFEFTSGVQVDEQALASFRDVAFEQGVSQQQAASIANLYANLVEQQAAGEQDMLEESEAGWLKELRKERNYAKTVASARLTMERFGTPELNDLLNETRLGSHPALVRFVAKIGQELGEPLFIQGKGHGRTGKLNFYETMES